MNMYELSKVVAKAVKGELKFQLGLVYSDIKELKEENKNLKQKYFDSLKRIKALEEALREKQEHSDFGV